MKKGIHPDYKTVTVKCACGATFETKSTADEIRVEICSKCHPFFTGRQKLVDTGGRVDRFKKRFGMDRIGSCQCSAKNRKPSPLGKAFLRSLL